MYKCFNAPLDCKIDGHNFLRLSRQDIAVLFPKEDQFIFGMNLYKYIEVINSEGPKTCTTNSDSASQPQQTSEKSHLEITPPQKSATTESRGESSRAGK